MHMRPFKELVAEVNSARARAGAPLLVSDPSYPLVVSVFDESNPRGANGSSAIAPGLSNHEVFFATFVDDTTGGSEVLFLSMIEARRNRRYGCFGHSCIASGLDEVHANVSRMSPKRRSNREDSDGRQ